MIEIRGLIKSVGQVTALAGIDLSIARGENIAIVGPPDGGATVLLQVLATLMPPTSGAIAIGGLDVVADIYRVRRLVAYAGPRRIHPNRLRVIEHLRLIAEARRQPLTAAASAAALVGLDPDASIDSFGDDLYRRLSLAAAVATGADVLLLDLPFAGLDEDARSRVSDWLVAARERGTTVVMAEGENENNTARCDRTVVIRAGRIVDVPTGSTRRHAGPPRELVGV